MKLLNTEYDIRIEQLTEISKLLREKIRAETTFQDELTPLAKKSNILSLNTVLQKSDYYQDRICTTLDIVLREIANVKEQKQKANPLEEVVNIDIESSTLNGLTVLCKLKLKEAKAKENTRKRFGDEVERGATDDKIKWVNALQTDLRRYSHLLKVDRTVDVEFMRGTLVSFNMLCEMKLYKLEGFANTGDQKQQDARNKEIEQLKAVHSDLLRHSYLFK